MRTNLRQILLFLSIVVYLAGGFLCISQTASSVSMEQNTIWAGYSFARLLMMVLMAAGMVGGLFVLGKYLIESFSKHQNQSNGMVHPGIRNPVILSFSLLIIIFLFYSVNLMRGLTNPDVSPFFSRGQPFFLWLEFVLIYAVFGMWLRYVKIIHSTGNWVETLADIWRFVQCLSIPFWIYILTATLAIGVMIVYSPALAGKIPRHDSGIFLYFGSRILEGDIPFRDLWDHKPPLIFYIDALGLILADRSIWGVWFLEVLSLLSTLFLVNHLLRKEIKAIGILLASLGFISGFLFSMEGGNLTEEFGLPLQAISLWLFYRYVLAEKHPRLAWVGIGLSLGLALMLKQTLIGVWAAVGIISIHRIFTRQLKMDFKRSMCFLGGLIVVTGAGVLYFALNGSLYEFWDVAYRYNFIYSDITWADRWISLWSIFSIVFFQRSFFLLAGLAAWIYFTVKSIGHFSKVNPILLIALVNFPLEIGLISLSGEDYDHYFFTVLISSALLLGFAWSALTDKIQDRKMLKGLIFVGFILVMSWNPGRQLISAYMMKQDVAILKVIDYVQENSAKDEYVLFWGDQTVLNFVTNRVAPTRFVHQKPLFRKGYASADFSAELLEEISTNKPTLIIDTHLNSTPFIHMDGENRCNLPEEPIPDGMDRVFDFICEHYRLADDLGGKDKWLVYKLH